MHKYAGTFTYAYCGTVELWNSYIRARWNNDTVEQLHTCTVEQRKLWNSYIRARWNNDNSGTITYVYAGTTNVVEQLHMCTVEQ